ncbi:MAG: adenylate kinase [Candidatus Bathyarchaeia archaeon]
MSKVVVVTGIPGSGKTTVCNELQKLAQASNKSVTVINFGTVMLEVSKKRGESLHRDELRKSSLKFQHDVQTETAEAISKLIAKAEGNIVVDTHMIVRTSEGYMPGLPQNVLQFIKPDVLVLVEAEAQEIVSRRAKDASRKRDEILEAEVENELAFSRLMACAVSVLTRAPVKIVKNKSGRQIEAAKELMTLLE